MISFIQSSVGSLNWSTCTNAFSLKRTNTNLTNKNISVKIKMKTFLIVRLNTYFMKGGVCCVESFWAVYEYLLDEPEKHLTCLLYHFSCEFSCFSFVIGIEIVFGCLQFCIVRHTCGFARFQQRDARHFLVAKQFPFKMAKWEYSHNIRRWTWHILLQTFTHIHTNT